MEGDFSTFQICEILEIQHERLRQSVFVHRQALGSRNRPLLLPSQDVQSPNRPILPDRPNRIRRRNKLVRILRE